MTNGGQLGVILTTLSLLFFPGIGLSQSNDINHCITCHTDEERLDELTEDAVAFGDDEETSDLQRGHGYAVKKAPFDLYEKILVANDFLKDPHGEIPCQMCHKGNPSTDDPETAHQGLITDPSLSPQQTCGQCHEEITETAVNSLHMNPAVLFDTLGKRCSVEQVEKLSKNVIKGQCMTCHRGNCGSCHVSRPDVAGGGLRDGHRFFKQPDFIYQCFPCHTSPTGNDFIGKRGGGDVHYQKFGMRCTDCHKGDQMHSAAEKIGNRFQREGRPSCQSCHQDLKKGTIPEHEVHLDKVDCAVCHATSYQNCRSCHMGVDEDNISYSVSPPPFQGFKIGKNPDKHSARYTLFREVAVDRDAFKSVIGKMKRFSALPTYKRAAPHTIQRRTWQNSDCNHCHGAKEIFLTREDMAFDQIVANRHILLNDNEIPAPVDSQRSPLLAPVKPDESIRVTSDWLKKHRNDKNLLILDTRSREDYERGHIPGAYHICFCLFRTAADEKPPYMMKPPEELAAILSGSRFGLTPKKRVVVYDDGRSGRGVAFLALSMIGHEKISFLDGNIQRWTSTGNKLVKGKAPSVKAKKYSPKKRHLTASNHDLIDKMGSGQAIVVDSRNLAQFNGDTFRTDISQKGGAIPEAISLPLRSLFDGDGNYFQANRLAWLLGSKGLSPIMSKTIFTTCNTNMLAAELFMVLSYLGYDNVIVHDGSWAEWAGEFEQ
ncbi:MAG: rhodanese-like domain-containing protein [Thermodesulfobacteriota bacterium]